MNWLAYLALVFASVCLFLHGPVALEFAIGSAACGFLSALLSHWSLLEKATSSFLAKLAVTMIALAALIVSPWVANSVVSEITLLRPSAFPAAYSAVQYIATLLLWAALAYCALIVSAGYNILQITRGAFSNGQSYDYIDRLFTTRKGKGRLEILASLGRLAGLLILLVYITPMFLRAANYDSGELLSRLVVATSFVENRGQMVSYSSIAPNLPSDCRRLAAEAKLDLAQVYTCSVRTVRCSNIDEDAKIAYLTDTDIVVAKDVDRTTPLYELNPVRFDMAKCDGNNRYEYRVSQR